MNSVATPKTQTIKARDLRIDDIVHDEDGTHEVTAIDPGGDDDFYSMGVTMHGEEAFGEFVYRKDDDLTITKR